MKLKGWVMSAGLAATAVTAAMAEPLPAAGTAQPPLARVSDVDGPHAAMPPPPPRREVRRMEPAAEVPEVLSPDEVTRAARAEGFAPLGYPRQRGLVYTMAAMNPDGEDGRLVIDARSGRLLRFMPAWQMGDTMEMVTVASYGRIQGLPRFTERNPPRPPRPITHFAGRPATTPLPRPAPLQPVGDKAAGAATAAAKDGAKDGAKPALDQAKQGGGKPEAARQDTAAAQTKPAAPPSAAGPTPAEVKKSLELKPTEPMPAVQGLE